jgi:hypothetical protein
MNPNPINRVGAAVILGVTFGWYTHHEYVRWNLLGREAFIAHEVQRFEQYMAVPRPMGFTIFGGVVVAIGLFGIYELLVLLLSKALKDTSSAGENT